MEYQLWYLLGFQYRGQFLRSRVAEMPEFYLTKLYVSLNLRAGAPIRTPVVREGPGLPLSELLALPPLPVATHPARLAFGGYVLFLLFL